MTVYTQFATAEDKLTFFTKGPTTDKSKTYQERKGSLNKTYTRKAKSSHAFIGEKIVFQRKNILINGVVVNYRTDSVIVEISEEQAEALEISNCLTVVSHKNYQIV